MGSCELCAGPLGADAISVCDACVERARALRKAHAPRPTFIRRMLDRVFAAAEEAEHFRSFREESR